MATSNLEQRFESLQKHFELILAERDIRYQQRFASGEQAIAKAEAAVERRFEGVNEFRKTLSDDATTYMRRAEAETRFHSITENVEVLRQRLDKFDGQRGGLHQGWTWLMGVAMFLVALVASVVGFFKGK